MPQTVSTSTPTRRSVVAYKPRYYAENPYGLDDEQIARECPAIFAETKHESRGDKYTYVSTRDLLAFLREQGLVPTYVRQSRSRIEGKTEFTKHLIRVRPQGELGKAKANTREIGIINSHDGTSSYQLMEWIYRLVCTNGLIRAEMNEDILRIPHKGDILGKVVEGTLTVLEESEETAATIEHMQQIQVPHEAQLALSQAMMAVRFDLGGQSQQQEQERQQQTSVVVAAANEVPSYQAHPIYEPQDFLRRRRPEDNSNDLYTVMNVVQENIIKGGVRRYVGHEKHTTCPVQSIDKLVEVNRNLWMFARHLEQVLG